MASVLEGVKVLDLSSGIAGPVAGMLLADHGADVVKVEPPGGDPLRGTAGYDAWIRGRRSAELDLKDAEERATFLALASDADVVLEIVLAGHHESTRHRRGYLARRQPAVGVLLDHRVRHAPGAPRPPRLGRAGGRPPRSAPRAARSSRGSGAAHERRRAVPAGPGDPRRHGTRVAPLGTDLHLHAVAEHGRRVPCRRRHQRRAPRARAHRPWTARRDLVAASGVQPHRVEVAARRAQRPARLPHLDLRPARAEGVLPLLRRPVGRAVGAEPALRALQRRRRHPRVPAGRRPRPRRPRPRRRPTRRTSSSSRTTTRRWRKRSPVSRATSGCASDARPASRSNRCARPKRRSATRRSKPTARSSTYRTPSTARSARWASSTASARLRDGSRGPCPTSAPTRSRCDRRRGPHTSSSTRPRRRTPDLRSTGSWCSTSDSRSPVRSAPRSSPTSAPPSSR